MALLSITITNTLPLQAMSPAVLWGSMVWGTDNWGLDGDTIIEVEKGITNTEVMTQENRFNVIHLVDMADLTLTSSVRKNMVRGTNNSLDLSEELSNITRGYGIWADIFTRYTTDGREKVFDESTRVSDGTDSFTRVADGSTTWSKQ